MESRSDRKGIFVAVVLLVLVASFLGFFIGSGS